MAKLLKKLNINIFERIVISLSFLFLVIISLGKFNRYVISEQLAHAINLERYGSLYNSTNIESAIHFTSYFPGTAYLFYLIKKIIPDFFLYEFILILSSLIVLFFFYLLKEIIKSLHGQNVKLENYWLIVIIFTLFFCDKWIFYATQFKGDTLAFSLIIFGFLISKIYLKNYSVNYWRLFLSWFLIIAGISVKQQAVLIVPALLIYSLFVKNYIFKIFSFLTIVSIFFLYFTFYKNENIWFHTISKYSQETFHPLNELFRLYIIDVVSIIIFIFLLFIFNKNNICKIDFSKKYKNFMSKKIRNFWVIVLIFFASTGIISALKMGGNSGNSQLALILFFPIIYIFICNFKKKYLILFSFILLIAESKNIVKNGYYYLEAKKFQKEMSIIVEKDNLKILSDKSTYFTVFDKEQKNQIFSLNTFRILNKYLFKKTTDDLIIESILKKNYDLIVVNNSVVNSSITIKKNYTLVYSNKLGKVYKINKK